jgi:hypothetical protein
VARRPSPNYFLYHHTGGQTDALDGTGRGRPNDLLFQSRSQAYGRGRDTCLQVFLEPVGLSLGASEPAVWVSAATGTSGNPHSAGSAGGG